MKPFIDSRLLQLARAIHPSLQLAIREFVGSPRAPSLIRVYASDRSSQLRVNCRDPAAVRERRLHPGKPTNPPAAIVSLVQLPTSGEPPLITAIEPSRSSSLGDCSCPLQTPLPAMMTAGRSGRSFGCFHGYIATPCLLFGGRAAVPQTVHGRRAPCQHRSGDLRNRWFT